MCGYTDLAERYGVELVDLQQDGFHARRVGDLEISVCNELERVDYLINLPVLKGHCQTRITCALKNLKGCIPNSEKRRFHTLGLHKPIAYLNKAVKTDLVIVDGLMGIWTSRRAVIPCRWIASWWAAIPSWWTRTWPTFWGMNPKI